MGEGRGLTSTGTKGEVRAVIRPGVEESGLFRIDPEDDGSMNVELG